MLLDDGAKKRLEELVEACISLEYKERPELTWLKSVYERYRKSEGFSGKAQADESIFRKMYGTSPKKPSDTLKIRYWRTGRHTPSNRSLCTAFGKAMNLSEEEMKTLLMRYYDRSDLVFEAEPHKEDRFYDLYWMRRRRMEELTEEYLGKLHPLRRMQLKVRPENMEQNLRHVYYMDARSYLAQSDHIAVEKHIVSANYESEFSRQLKILGEIPRRTMLRHLIILGQPFLSRALLNQFLEEFGYLPLDKTHTTAVGERLDRLVLGFLELYEEYCTGWEPKECITWFREAYRLIDRDLEMRERNNLRFLYFKTLKG